MSVLPEPRGEPVVAGNTIAPLANYINNDTPIFALNDSGGGGGGGNPAPQFVATGLAGAGGFVSQGAGANVKLNNGTFVSYVDTTAVPPGGAEVVVLGSDALGLEAPRWTIGYNNSDVGDGFGGADLAIKCYADNGNLLATPFTITRETATVNITEGLIVNGAVVGAPAVAGGGVLSIDGTLGLGRVYDELYNVPPGGGVATITGSEYIAVTGTASNPILTATGLVPASAPFNSETDYLQGLVNVGITFGIAMTPGTYTAPRTGLYIISASCIVNVASGVGTGFCSIGEYDNVNVTISNIGSGFTSTVSMKPWSMPNTDATPQGFDYIATGSAVVSLTEGLVYQLSGATINASTPNIMVFPSTGGPGGSGVKLTASVTPLC